MAVRLKTLQYGERRGRSKEWLLDPISLGPINLIVGTNATGKTRTLNVIGNLAKQFVPEPRFRSLNCGYDVLFESGADRLRYVLVVDEGKVRKEELYVNDEVMLIRGPTGEGEIFAEVERRRTRFKPPENEPAAVARRDSLQHPFLEPLHEWALGVRHYYFGTPLGKDHLVMIIEGGPGADDRDPNQVVGIFRKGEREFGRAFTDAVIADMVGMGYELDQITVCPPDGVELIAAGRRTEVYGLGVTERGVTGTVDQSDMSQGMFRALSILIQVNYSQLGNRSHCILIDDIGEGLDFDRATRLIALLRQKAHNSAFQLVMTTNDRFVMNNVPLDEWSVLRRRGNRVEVLNNENAPKLFEDFKFTGLSNFSFLEMGFAEGGPETEAAGHEEARGIR